jgi:geranylgeranyl diphosphate synthase, type II
LSGDNSKFLALYERERKKVEKRLSDALKNREPHSLYKPAAYILKSGGKRLRPLLVLFSAKASGGKFSKAYNAAVAVELLHNFTLVHDDIMDNADKRRGRLTLHKKYDLNTAILAGDSLLSVAYEYLIKDSKDHLKEVLDSFTHGLVEVCEGQSMDKDFELLKEVSIEEYMLMIEKKTAAMAEMCCIIGANIAGASKQEIKAMAGFGKNIGIAFQIQDDLLDISGNESEFGKFVGGDLVEGKKTFLFLKALEKSRGKDKKEFIRITERKGIKQDEIPKFKALYCKLGVLEDAREEIVRYSNRALSELKYLKKQEDRDFFIWLTDSLIKRNR